MRYFCIPSLCIFFALWLTNCAPETAATSSPPVTHEMGDIMDVSTWDTDDSLPTTQPLAAQNTAQYAIVVATFAGDNSEQSAASARVSLANQYPLLGRNLSVRKRSRGTALTFGNYTGYDDPEAIKDMSMLRSITSSKGSPLFGQVLLLKFKTPRERNNLHPHDLWTARRDFPTIVPMFTLEVAVWGDFESGEFPLHRRQAAAEGYASRLRAKGFEAFYYHNDDGAISSVTVGLFGPTAINPETGFYAPEVDAMLSRFPERLVNGQPIRVYFDSNNPSLGSSVQRPCLAEVPVD
jgi:hypothetical protein